MKCCLLPSPRQRASHSQGVLCRSGTLGHAARHPLGLVDLVRGRVEGRVDAARHCGPAGIEVVAMAAKLPTLNHPLLDLFWQLRFDVVKHLLQGNL